MSKKTFDINCDMGEGYGNWRMADDAKLATFVSTANLACGFHAGDPVIMQRTVRVANAAGLAIGAHPGLPDLLGFGRRAIHISAEELRAYIIYQVGALQGFLSTIGARLNHVKPHGALFSMLRDPKLALTTLEGIAEVAPSAAIYWSGPAGREPFSVIAAERGIRVCSEAYPDLDYTDDGSLVVEREKKSVDPRLVYNRVVEIISKGTLTNFTGVKLPMRVDSICIHSDGPNALELVEASRRAVIDCGLTVGAATNEAK